MRADWTEPRDYSVLDDGDIVGRILLSPVAPQNRPRELSQRQDAPSGARLRGHARGHDGGVRQELATATGAVSRYG
jgi:hypothetical protein